MWQDRPPICCSVPKSNKRAVTRKTKWMAWRVEYDRHTKSFHGTWNHSYFTVWDCTSSIKVWVQLSAIAFQSLESGIWMHMQSQSTLHIALCDYLLSSIIEETMLHTTIWWSWYNKIVRHPHFTPLQPFCNRITKAGAILCIYLCARSPLTHFMSCVKLW